MRKLRFGAFFSVPSRHPIGWRHPDAVPEADLGFKHLVGMARTAERGCLDTLFFQDSVAVVGSTATYGQPPFNPRNGRQAHIEPMTAIAGLAAVTSRIGLISTCTTTYNEPYNVARRFFTIDHLSGGRAGWNLVTSQIEDEARNFGFEEHLDHAARYARASEFYDVVVGLWDSWEDGGLLRDKASGLYMDRDRVHFLDHDGPHFRVRGPLTVARTPQGRPVVAQAGSSEAGRELAAKTADVVFNAQTKLDEAQAFYHDLKSRLARYGREPDDLKIMPGITPVIGATMAEAQARYDELQALMPDDVALQSLSHISGGLDLSTFPLDGPLPDLPPSNAAKARQDLVVRTARARDMTLREIARHTAAGTGHRVLVGTAACVADELEAWFRAGAADGFNVICNYCHAPFEAFARQVIPELQRRGVFRTEYEGTTLRENLGLQVPENRWTAAKHDHHRCAGLPDGLLIHTADIQDRDGAVPLPAFIRRCYPWLRHAFADGGDAGQKLIGALRGMDVWTVQIVKRSDSTKGFVVLPRRWVVERTFAWLGRNRRLAKDCEKSIASAEAWAMIASIRLMAQQLAKARFCRALYERRPSRLKTGFLGQARVASS